ncbi:MAG: hypothetical protein ACRC8S_00440 [Fimbriiglobus sp.]
MTPPTGRADFPTRFTAISLGLVVGTLGALAPGLVAGKWCAWIGWVCFALFVPCSLVVVFLGFRGRAEDLHAFSPKQLAAEFGAGCALEILFAVVLLCAGGLLALL